MPNKVVAGLVMAAALGLPLAGCQDTKARQENEQLKTQVLQLQKENGDLGNRVEEITKQNVTLENENQTLQARRPAAKTPKAAKPTKTAKRKRRQRRKATA